MMRSGERILSRSQFYETQMSSKRRILELGIYLFSPGVHCKDEGHKTSCLARWRYTRQKSIEIPVQQTQCRCDISYFSAVYSDSYQIERTIASSQITRRYFSLHLTAAVDTGVTNQINEIYLQPKRAKVKGLLHVMSFVFRHFSQNCDKKLLASSCPSVHPPALKEQLGSHWKDFHEI